MKTDIFCGCGDNQLGIIYYLSGQMAHRMQHFQQIIQEQSTPHVGIFRANHNKAKINFGITKKQEEKNYQYLIESEAIDPWNTNTYSRQEDIRGLRRIMQSHKKKKKNAINYINRAAITSRSWNAERERLLNLRQQMHIPTPVFQATGTSKNESEQEGNKKNSTSQSSRSFKLHKKLLSRIYSHSYQPQIVIKKLPLSTEKVDRPQSKPHLAPSLKMRKTSYTRKEKTKKQEQNQDQSEYWQVRKWATQKQSDIKLPKSKSIGISNSKKQRLKIV